MRDPGFQCSLRDLLLAVSSFAVTFALFVAAMSQQSPFLLFVATVILGATCGGSIGFLMGGRRGVRIGSLIGVAIAFIFYFTSVAKYG